jgi:ribosome assembly protein 1
MSSFPALWMVGHSGMLLECYKDTSSLTIPCRVQQFASLYAKKLGFKEQVLQKCLWGEYYFDPKAKRVILPKHLKGRNLKPMFVQFVLENIWAVYGSVVIEP